jgi:excisionase family DNA binding protein
MDEQLLTVQEVMGRLKVSRATVYRLIDGGTLRPVKIGKSVRFRPSEVSAIINPPQLAAEG